MYVINSLYNKLVYVGYVVSSSRRVPTAMFNYNAIECNTNDDISYTVYRILYVSVTYHSYLLNNYNYIYYIII